MNKDYRSLEDFISDTKGEELSGKVLKYIRDNRNSIDLDELEDADDDSLKVEDLMIKSVKCEKTKLQGEIILNIYAYAELIGDIYGRTEYKLGDCRKYFFIKIKGSMETKLSKFKLLDICEEKGVIRSKDVLTDHLIPYIKAQSMDEYASDFLKEYCPKALEEPTKLSMPDILKKMGLESHFAPMEDGVFGKTYFSKSRAKVFESNLFSEIEQEVNEGTVLINPNCYFFGNIGSLNNTITHECVHWYLHRNFFELLKILQPKATHIECESDSKTKGFLGFEDDLRWIEWQANTLAPKILVPRNMGILKFEECLKAADFYNEESSFEKSARFNLALNSFADFFGVSKMAAKIRLIELGYPQAIGTNNYCDDEVVEPFFFKKGTLKEGQSYLIDRNNAAFETLTNKKLSSLVTSGTFVYVQHFFVLNDEKFIDRDSIGNPVMSDYALNHMDECCLAFDCKIKKKNLSNSYYSLCYLCRRIDPSNKLEMSYDENCLAEIDPKDLEKVKRHNQKIYEMMKTLPSSPGETIKEHIKRKKITQEELAYRSGLSTRVISSYCNDSPEGNPTINSVVAICIGLNLSPDYSRDLIGKFGLSIDSKHDTLHSSLQFIIDSCHMCTLDSCNDVLFQLSSGKVSIPK